MLLSITFTGLGLYVLAELWSAYLDGWAFDWQVRMRKRVPEKYLTFWDHWGMHGDFWIINPIVAYTLSRYAKTWPLAGTALVAIVVAIAGWRILIPLIKESEQIPSALARDGRLPLAGKLHYVYYVVGMTTCVSYLLFTSREVVRDEEPAIIAAGLAVHWGIGLLQPPFKVHRKIHAPAWIATGTGWVVMFGVVYVRFYR